MNQLYTYESFRAKLWRIAARKASKAHPWFSLIIDRKLTREQVIAGEMQHYLRVLKNEDFYRSILKNAEAEGDERVINVARANYEEEVLCDPSHADLLFQLLDEAGYAKEHCVAVSPSNSTRFAIDSILRFCEEKSAIEGIAFTAFVEAQNAGEKGVAYKVYQALTEHYGFSKHGAETFLEHSIVDEEHGKRQIDLVCEVATDIELQARIINAVEAGTTTFSIEWSGHLEAALGLRD